MVYVVTSATRLGFFDRTLKYLTTLGLFKNLAFK